MANQIEYHIPNAVDLGLPSGILWSDCNLGATSAEELGYYYGYGEIKPKGKNEDWKYNSFSVAPSKLEKIREILEKEMRARKVIRKGMEENIRDMVNDRLKDLSLEITIEPEGDVASISLGNDWRIPTDADFTELRQTCSWVWREDSKTKGYQVTGPNGNSIFLPCAGKATNDDYTQSASCGCYWSSNLYTESYPYAWYLYFSKEFVYRGYFYLYVGMSIRPVKVSDTK